MVSYKVVRRPSLTREHLNGARWEDTENSMLGRRNSEYGAFQGNKLKALQEQKSYSSWHEVRKRDKGRR